MKPAYYRIIMFFDEGDRSLSELAEKAGLTRSSVKKYISFLAREGLVARSGEDKYKLTEKGLLFKGFLESVIKENVSAPYVITDPDSGSIIPLSFKNYIQLWATVTYGLVDKRVAEEHFNRGYLKEWIKNVLNDQHTYELIENGSIKTLDDLLSHIEKALKIVASK